MPLPNFMVLLDGTVIPPLALNIPLAVIVLDIVTALLTAKSQPIDTFPVEQLIAKGLRLL